MIRVMSRSLRAALAACLMVISSTAITVGQTDESLVQLTAHDWTLTALDGTDVPADAGITATFSKDGLLSGSGGCNNYSASYRAEGPSLQISPIAATFTTCGDEVDARENEYFRILQGALGYSVDDVSLAIASERGVLEFAAGSGGASLTDASWTLAEVDSEPVEDVIQTATFLPDGTVAGSGGCNSFSASYTTDGETLAVTDLGVTRMACDEDVMEAEDKYLDAFEAAATWSINGSQLTITSAADVELVFDGTAIEGPSGTPGAPATPAAEPSEDPPETGTIVGITWLVTELAESPITTEITAVFGEDGTLTGNGGCNEYSASYRLDGDDLSIRNLTQGNEQCDPITMGWESGYLLVLPFMDSLELEDGVLTMSSSTTGVDVLFEAQ
jgi:heat shock protein HslJ